MGIHKHHSTPLHLGGYGPIQLLEDIDHAKVHAERFLNGEDNGFHMGLLKFLPEETKNQVKQHQSNLMKTDWNPGFGTSFVLGMKWWTNGVDETLSHSCPDGWTPGRPSQSRETRLKKSESNTGKIWWNNGTEERWSHDQPEGFIRGRLPRKGNKWKPVILIDTFTGETTTFESQKLCRDFLKVTKKVLLNRLKSGKLINERFTVHRG